MELVSICLIALGLYSRGEQLLLIRVRLDCKSNKLFTSTARWHYRGSAGPYHSALNSHLRKNKTLMKHLCLPAV